MRQPRPHLLRTGGLFSNALPRPFHVPDLCVRLSHAEAKSEFAVEFRMGQKEMATAVQAIHNPLIDRIASLVTKAHQVQWNRRSQFEVLVFADPIRELLRQLHVAANVMLQALHPVVALVNIHLCGLKL